MTEIDCNSLDLLMKWTGKPPHEIIKYLLNGTFLVADEWNRQNPQTDEEIERFYKTSEFYLYDLEAHHIHKPVAMRDLELVREIFKDTREEISILDFGCGTGVNSIDIARNIKQFKKDKWTITAFDYDNPSTKFAKFKAKEFDVPINFLHDLEQLKTMRFDYILAMDVVEHSPRPMEMLKLFTSLKRDIKSRIFYIIDFSSNPFHPMHMPISDKEKEEMERYIVEQGMIK